MRLVEDSDATLCSLPSHAMIPSPPVPEEAIESAASVHHLDPSQAAIFAIVRSSPASAVGSDRRSRSNTRPECVELDAHVLRDVFANLDESNRGLVSFAQLRRIVDLDTSTAAEFREWLLLPPREMSICDSFFAHMWNYCVARCDGVPGYLSFAAFASAIGELAGGPADFTFTTQLNERAWARPDLMKSLMWQLRGPLEICGSYTLRPPNVSYGSMLGSVFVLPTPVLSMCCHVVDDPKHEFHAPLNVRDAAQIGYDILRSFVSKECPSQLSGVFCVATYDRTVGAPLSVNGSDALASIPEEVRSSAMRYFGGYERTKIGGAETWQMRVLRVERLRVIRRSEGRVGPFDDLSTVLQVDVLHAFADGVRMRRDVVTEGDVTAPPLLLESTRKSFRDDDNDITQRIFPGNRFVRIPFGMMEKRDVASESTVPSLITKDFLRFLPREQGDRIVA
eukprot:g1098.t1